MSTCATDWLERQQMFMRSSAVMCMIGYIIGLGDRHLDNILLDLRSGELVHIDYNMCFDKALKLRIPERVPCRLSANFRKPLGFAELEGAFKQACQHVMRTLRTNRETLLTLLEAFVYDPLLDWTPDTESDRQRRLMDRETAASLLSSRIAGLRKEIDAFANSVSGAISDVLKCSQVYSDTVLSLQRAKNQVRVHQEEIQVVRAAVGANPTPQHFSALEALYTARASTSGRRVAILQQAATLYHTNNTIYQHAAAAQAALQTNALHMVQERLPHMCSQSTFVVKIDQEAKTALISVGLSPHVEALETFAADRALVLSQRCDALKALLMSLGEYQTIVRNLPSLFTQTASKDEALLLLQSIVNAQSDDELDGALAQYIPKDMLPPRVQDCLDFAWQLVQTYKSAHAFTCAHSDASLAQAKTSLAAAVASLKQHLSVESATDSQGPASIQLEPGEVNQYTLASLLPALAGAVKQDSTTAADARALDSLCAFTFNRHILQLTMEFAEMVSLDDVSKTFEVERCCTVLVQGMELLDSIRAVHSAWMSAHLPALVAILLAQHPSTAALYAELHTLVTAARTSTERELEMDAQRLNTLFQSSLQASQTVPG